MRSYVENNPVNRNDPMGLDTQISLGFTQVTPALGPIPESTHQFVILTDTETGQQFAVRAGPSAQGFLESAGNSSLSASGGSLLASSGNAGAGGFGFGQIEAKTGVFDETFGRDFQNQFASQNIGVIGRDFSDSVSNAIEFVDVTNQNNIPYFPAGLNSNSFATTFVESLTGTRPESDLWAPGSGFGSPSPDLSFSPSSFVTGGSTGSAASGGFVLYPSKPNTNSLLNVYAK